ncbi:MAG TPA: MarR family transcriptional regulator [Acidimicrobiales bacterium]|nr:MarR family transcriptional regulator [Acidimicrobiales bacterium]
MSVDSTPLAGAPAPVAAQDTDTDAAVAARLRLAVTRLHRLLRQQVAAGLTPSQISALSTTERLGAPTLGELATAEQVQPPSMTRMAAALESAGLLERLMDPADGRVVRVRVSPDGQRTLQRIRSLRTAVLAKRLRRLSPDERQRLSQVVSLLERLVER